MIVSVDLAVSADSRHSKFFHLFAAAFFAISARRSGVMLSAHFLPPARPNSCAVLFFAGATP